MNIDTLERLARAATPGNWVYRSYLEPQWSGRTHYVVETEGGLPGNIVSDASEYDATFIAACSPGTILGVVQRVRELEEALREIETRRTPCGTCGRLHEWRANVPEGFVGTWADPIDGHDYRAEKPSLTAQKVLAKRTLSTPTA